MGIIGVGLALTRRNRLVAGIVPDVGTERVLRVKRHHIDVEPGPILGHFVFQIDLHTITDVDVQRQRTRLQLAGLDPTTITIEDIHLALLIAEDHLALEVDFHHTRCSVMVPDLLVDRRHVEGLHWCISRTDRRSGLLNLLPTR